MSEQKRYTAQEMRAAAASPTYVGGDFAVHVKPEVYDMLEQAADMRERCERMKVNIIPHKHDKEIVDYILRGDAEKEEQ